MKLIEFPKKQDWQALCKRPVMDTSELEGVVKSILQKVLQEGDSALFEFAERFDKVKLESLALSTDSFDFSSVSEELKQAIQLAKSNIEKFHSSQKEGVKVIETQPGVKCWRKSLPIEKVGLYIPGGSAPLFSTLLMLGIPAKLADCKEIVVCTPANKEGKVHPAILYTAQLIGIDKVYLAGGAQAVAAMAYGTDSIPKVDKIFGPGNQYVTMAKQLVQQEGVAIDMPAGPSEVLVITDDTSIPAFVAADLLSQAEHGPDSQVVLVSDSKSAIEAIQQEVEKQLLKLSREAIATKALEKSFAVLVNDLNEAIDFSNVYAPEHLILATEKANELAELVSNAGSVFIGNWSCESAGDYASGTNHTLPTNAYARSYSGVSLDSFVRKVTFQQLNEKGIQNIGPAIEQMAEAEGLDAHKNAVTVRLDYLKNV